MTTIVYKNGLMGGDTRAWNGDRRYVGAKQKIRRLGASGFLAGVSTGQLGWSERILDRLAEYVKRPSFKDFNSIPEPPGWDEEDGYTIIAINSDGEAWQADDAWSFTGPIKAPYFAIGTGRDFAAGAFEVGADVETALNIAIRCDPLSGPPFDIIQHASTKVTRVPARDRLRKAWGR